MSRISLEPTYGVEEELWVIDRVTLAPSIPHPDCMAQLNRHLGIRVAREYKAPVIELVTGVHTSPLDLTEEVAANRYEAGIILARWGYAALPLATHPSANSIATPARKDDRYSRIEKQKGFAVRRLAANGVHMHVGTYPDDAERLRALPKLMHLTVLHAAITACSPFIDVLDAGQASWRLRILMQLASPLPLTASGPEELARICSALAAAGGPRDPSEHWGLVRLGAGKPTIEFRAADTMPNLDYLPWLGALTGAAVHAERNGALPPLALSEAASAYLYAANLDRAAAEGAEAILVDPFDLQPRSVQDTLDAWEIRLAPSIDILRLGDAIGLRPRPLGAQWRDMKQFADVTLEDGLMQGLCAADAQAFAFRRTIERALIEAAQSPQMPWLRQAIAA